MDDGGTDVKIHDLPPRMNNKLIEEWMARYGEVISIRDFKWSDKVFFKNKDNGVRIVRIRLQKAIPSYITVHNEETYITYKNQIPTCRHCGYKAHRGRGCMENKLVLAEREGLSVNSRMDIARSSYANVVSQTAVTDKYQERMEDGACAVEVSTGSTEHIDQLAGSSMMSEERKVGVSDQKQSSKTEDHNTDKENELTLNNKTEMGHSNTSLMKKLTLASNGGSMEMDSEVDSDETNTREEITNTRNEARQDTNHTTKTGKSVVKHKLSETDTTDDDRGKAKPSRKKR